MGGGPPKPDGERAMRHLLLALLASVAMTTLAPSALAAGGRYAFDGGTARK